MHMSKYSHCLSRDKLRKLTMTLHMLAQTDLLSWSKHFFVIFLNIIFLFYCHSFEHNYWQSFFYLILKVFLHTSVRLTLLLWTQLISVTWTVNLFSQTLSHHDQIHMWLLYCVNTIFKNWEEKSRKVNFLIVNNKKVNFSYWLSFLLLSQASYMFISIFSSSSFRYLCSQFNTQNKT
jgi:hypothetical protein